MGLGNLPIIVANLLKHGRAPETPAAVIRMGTTGEQQTVLGTLADIVEKSAAMEPPALIVIGDVVSLSEKLDWFLPHAHDRILYGFESTSEPARA
jgi:uroporphyrinogen III methyltransferase/synthase